jgi:hypothetical protein
MATVDEDLNQLERDIRQLKIEYEQYFGGGRNRPPTETVWRIEQMIKRYSERGGQINFGQRFRFNNLAQTFAKYQDVFRKRMKAKEEGFVQRHFGAAAKAIEAEREKVRGHEPPPAPAPTPAEARRAAREAGSYVMATSDPEREAEKVKQLYQVLVEAKQKAGEKTDSLNLESFQKFVSKKAQQLKKEKGTAQVEFAVSVEGGQVKLKARVKS